MIDKSRTLIMSAAFCSLALVLVSSAEALAQGGFGSIEGQFVLEGDIPAPEIKVKKGDQSAKDPDVCAAQNLYSDALVVNPENKGIANVFVYMPKASKIHPDLVKSKEKDVVFDQKNCAFIPHALIVRTDQTVLVKSDDSIAHNTHTHPIINQEINQVIPANDRKGVPYRNPAPEILPTSVTCDFHPHMQAWWLILDHPYAAITDADGKFKIEKLPAGEHTLRVWHERSGWVDRAFKVKVTDGGVTQLEPVKVPVAKFKG